MKHLCNLTLVIALAIGIGAGAAWAAGACEKKIDGAWAYSPEDPNEKEMTEQAGGLTFFFDVEGGVLKVTVGNEDKTIEIEFKECTADKLVFVGKRTGGVVEVVFQKKDRVLLKAGGASEMTEMLFTRTQEKKSALKTTP